MNQSQMLDHLTEKHGIETKELQCSKRMLLHVDSDTWFSSKYEVTIPNGINKIRLINECVSQRNEDDMMLQFGGSCFEY